MTTKESSLNPLASNVRQVRRHGPETPSSLRPYRGGAVHAAIMAVPDEWQKCVIAGRFEFTSFVVVPPTGVTSYQLSWGRWSFDKLAAKELAVPVAVDKGINEWTDDGNAWYTGVATVKVASFMDPVGVYVSDLMGVVSSGGFQFYWRGA